MRIDRNSTSQTVYPLFPAIRVSQGSIGYGIDDFPANIARVTIEPNTLLADTLVDTPIINDMTFDGATEDAMKQAVRDALIAFMAATAQAQAEATKEAQKAGIAAAREKIETYRGRKPSYDRSKLVEVLDMLGQGHGASAIAKASGLSRTAVRRIIEAPGEAEAALARWE